jgi:hypothetical protein
MIDLSRAQAWVMWTLAQHKYGWRYLTTVGDHSAARALERKGLIGIAEFDRRCILTTAGDDLVAALWPKSPAALETYERPADGWDLFGDQDTGWAA